MMDLIERLRFVVKNDEAPQWYWDHPDKLRNPDGPEAADVIEQLEKTQRNLINAFRKNAMNWAGSEYNPEEFDKLITKLKGN